jgi:hypothetical protein
VQIERRRRVEALIRLAAPALDLVLFAGDRVSRVVGRNQIGPEPARRPALEMSAEVHARARAARDAD